MRSYKTIKSFLAICCFVSPTYIIYRLYLVREGPPCMKKSCGCETCITDQGVSHWFDKRFNSRIEPLLTSDNQNIPPAVLLWWLGLQSKHPKLSFVHSRLFEIMPKSDPLKTDDFCRCRRCAIVGNSKNLKGSNYGELIDSQDFVIRMNRAVTKGYELDVGKKTTHHFMYPESAQDLEPNIHLVLVPFKPRDIWWFSNVLSNGNSASSYTRLKRYIKVDKDKAAIFHPAFFKYISDSWTEHHGRYPSTGMLALIFGLHICDQLSVFGYGMDSKGNWYHYWENNRLAGAFHLTGVHNASFEAKIISRLAEIGKIQLYRGRREAS
ncbi:CMP-N-acetylneuraminate-beta-galactosamide-alpha-2,3-sialyltransferase 2-like [Heptranchias perlo]|uniref:CMP-N-acetylneuraminate-beta-galactosamide- alpha-2,3-sialyltransferase 2-like n=1 Tax=Heptranchias perlo TaxID=212740 RepID=UPI0035598AC7